MFVMNAESKRVVQAFQNEDGTLTFVQSHPDENSEDGFVQHRVTIELETLASILSEFGLAEVDYVEDDDE